MFVEYLSDEFESKKKRVIRFKKNVVNIAANSLLSSILLLTNMLQLY